MAMTVTESNAVNVVLDYLYGPGPHSGRRVPPGEAQVRDAAKVLAQGSYRRLSAGRHPKRIPERPIR